ncbi:MAG: aminomethyl-transferring glycine dehydrogenase subunit GcvPA [Deltaproteobacteria bacterium]|nr:aminomethyl-transferring glycine dehydrogenase subunit GcvPA [Deltaproteobacteria bacterium]
MRYIPLTPKDRKEMLADMHVSSTDVLFSDIPTSIRRGDMQSLPLAKSESELRTFFYQRSLQNIDPYTWKTFVGGGCYQHYIPSVVNQLVLRGEFLTAYTPYQAEISQGTLQAIFEYQSMIANLTGMEVANASMYDGASACAEAVLMSLRINKGKHVYLSSALHPDYITAVKCYLSDYEVSIHMLAVDENGQTVIGQLQPETACVVLGQTNFYGVIEPLEKVGQALQESKALFVVAIQEAMSLGMLPAPGDFGVDIVAGEGQSLGVEANYGGPHVGLFATRKKFVRNMPGRLAGKTVDENGDPGYVLTLSTREQHIRREKATSNICTNNALCALKSCIYMACVGEKGLREIAYSNYQQAHALYQQLTSIEGIAPKYKGEFFNEFVLQLPIPAVTLIERLQDSEIVPGIPLNLFDPTKTHELLVAVTETTSKQDISALVEAIKGAL